MDRQTLDYWNGFALELAEDEVRRVARLPAYDQFPLCHKCGSAPVSVTYREPPTFQLHSSDRFTAQTTGSLVYVCGYCSYRWETKPLGHAFRGSCGALDPMGKGTCDLPAEPAHEIHRMRIRKGEWYSRCWMPSPDYADGWIEGEICWRDSPEAEEC